MQTIGVSSAMSWIEERHKFYAERVSSPDPHFGKVYLKDLARRAETYERLKALVNPSAVLNTFQKNAVEEYVEMYAWKTWKFLWHAVIIGMAIYINSCR